MSKKVKCKYCSSAANNATSKKGLYVCRCYLLQNDNGTLTQYEKDTQNVLFTKKERG